MGCEFKIVVNPSIAYYKPFYKYSNLLSTPVFCMNNTPFINNIQIPRLKSHSTKISSPSLLKRKYVS